MFPCLGDDGLLKHSFVEFWDDIHTLLLDGLQHIFERGDMSTLMYSCIISLIPKDDLSFELCHWQPITLLSTPHKILDHLIRKHLKLVWFDLIHSS